MSEDSYGFEEGLYCTGCAYPYSNGNENCALFSKQLKETPQGVLRLDKCLEVKRFRSRGTHWFQNEYNVCKGPDEWEPLEQRLDPKDRRKHQFRCFSCGEWKNTVKETSYFMGICVSCENKREESGAEICCPEEEVKCLTAKYTNFKRKEEKK